MKNWKNNKAYQQKQQLRSIALQSKPGYEANIERGKVEKENEKEARKHRRLARLKQKEKK